MVTSKYSGARWWLLLMLKPHVHECTHARTHARTHAHTHTHTVTCMRTHTHTHTVTCMRARTHTHTHESQYSEKVKTIAPELQSIQSEAPWDVVGVDFIGPFTKTPDDNTYRQTGIGMCHTSSIVLTPRINAPSSSPHIK